ANLTGGLTLNNGTLELNYVSNTASKLNGGSLRLAGGLLKLSANAANPVTQTMPSGTIVSANHSDIQGFSGAGTSLTLALGSITRSATATMDVDAHLATTFSATTSATVTNGLLGLGPAFATFNAGATWATVTGGTIAG